MPHIPNHLLGDKLCELVEENGDWKWQDFQGWFLENLQQKLFACIPSEKFVIIGIGAAEFSIKAMYNSLCKSEGGRFEIDSKKIWRLNVLERVRYFFWMLAHDRLLPNYNKRKMRISQAMCKLCQRSVETIMHAFRDCPRAMQVWENMVPTNIFDVFLQVDFTYWITLNLESNCSDARNWSEYWAMAFHCVRMWRNKEEQDEDFNQPVNPRQHVAQMVNTMRTHRVKMM